MANEREHRSDNDNGEAPPTTGQRGDRSEYGELGNPSPPDEGGGMSGQPIGGNDSNTGSGTTLTAGYSPPRETPGEDGELGQGTTSNAGASSVGADQTSGGSSGVTGGKGFIGARAGGDESGRQGSESAEEEQEEAGSSGRGDAV
jgi:hypothetical protein